MAGAYMGKYCIVDPGTGQTEVVETGDAFYNIKGKTAATGGRFIISRLRNEPEPFTWALDPLES